MRIKLGERSKQALTLGGVALVLVGSYAWAQNLGAAPQTNLALQKGRVVGQLLNWSAGGGTRGSRLPFQSTPSRGNGAARRVTFDTSPLAGCCRVTAGSHMVTC